MKLAAPSKEPVRESNFHNSQPSWWNSTSSRPNSNVNGATANSTRHLTGTLRSQT